jgi:hypothetical protein
MLLPTKHLAADRSLMSVGSRVLSHLSMPSSVSELWHSMEVEQQERGLHRVSFDWFLLALSMLYAIGKISFNGGVVARERE